MIQQHTNRASALFEKALANVRLTLKPVLDETPACFSYWVDEPVSQKDAAMQADRRVLRLVDRRTRNKLANKATLAATLARLEIDDVFPTTFDDPKAALAASAGTDLWFVKNIHGTGGKNMRCVTTGELADLTLGPYQVVQAGVTDIALIDGRKFTTRIYILIWNRRVFLYRGGFMVLHSRPYVPSSVDYKVQIDHTGYASGKNGVDMAPFETFERFEPYMASIKTAAERLMPALEECRHATDADTYLILGLDALLLSAGGVRFLEINAVPNFVHTDEINTQVNIPFFEACLKRMFYHPADRLMEIEPPQENTHDRP